MASGGAEVVRVPARRGIEAVDILRLRGRCGPVLHDPEGRTLGFVVPEGTAPGWRHPDTACTREPAVALPLWLVAPGETGCPATDPGLLRAALDEAARTLDAAAAATD